MASHSNTVLVLNASYEPLHRVSLQHALRMLARGVAVVEEAASAQMIGPWQHPSVLRLVRYIRMGWMYRATGCSFSKVKKRDGRCAYCGGKPETVDHLVPKSRGGQNTWLNLVAACLRCNQRKADRTPEEAGMKLLFSPHVPNPAPSHLQLAA